MRWLLMVTVCAGVLAAASPAQARASGYDYVVAQDGSGDYTTIQAAIDGAKSFPYDRITIFVKDGVYEEKVKVHAWNPKISLIGESAEGTVITHGDHFDAIDRGRNSTFFTYTLLVQANDFIARNLTVENTAGPVGQAVALHVEGDRAVFENCRLLGHQDTVFASGEGSRQYFKNCYIEGTTDFIFGGATAVFEDCHIHARESGSYITAASTPEGVPFGFVFIDCRLTAAPGVEQVYLGRPWRNYARTVFIGTEMGPHVHPAGWHDWSKPEAEATTFYAEYGNTGPGADRAERVDWSHALTPKEAARYTIEHIFSAERQPVQEGTAWYDVAPKQP